MILSNQGIRRALTSGDIQISPSPQEAQYTTSAVDLTLGEDFLQWDKKLFSPTGVKIEIDLAQHQFNQTAKSFLSEIPKEGDGSVIFPPYHKEPVHILGQTREKVTLNRGALVAARVEGRSSLARVGLVVHLTAPIIHCGFSGNITLEMINYGPFYLRLVPRETKICQLVFERLESLPDGDIQTAFQGQSRPSGEHR